MHRESFSQKVGESETVYDGRATIRQSLASSFLREAQSPRPRMPKYPQRDC